MKRICIISLCALVVGSIFAATRSFAQDSTYSADFTKSVGKVRALNGVNLWANIACGGLERRQAEAQACHFSTVRLHDAPWDNCGLRIVDVHQIFGNLKADPKDPDNYFFEATDDYIANILKAGSVPVYRLGTSIEHTVNKYFAKEPEDPEHYAEICAGIVRHYNKGWANGYEWNLPYWEIWNEPDIGQMWDKDWSSYCRFYVVVAKRLRAEFPNIKIGGPAIASPRLPMVKEFVDMCKKEGAPLDFFSWHCYPSQPSQVVDVPALMRQTLDEAGFPNAELHLNEWHYFPTSWDDISSPESNLSWNERPDGKHGYISAGFNGLVLTRWQDTPLTMANYYSFSYRDWGLLDGNELKRPTYYSLKYFGELVDSAPIRVATTDDSGSVAILGGKSENGEVKTLLVSIFKREATSPIEISLKGVPASGKARLSTIDKNGVREGEIEYADAVLKLDSQDSGIYFVQF